MEKFNLKWKNKGEWQLGDPTWNATMGQKITDNIDELIDQFQNGTEIYSFNEIRIGTYIDENGKKYPLYKKTIKFGNLPNNTTKEVKTGLDYNAKIIEISATADYNDETPLSRYQSTIPFYNAANQGCILMTYSEYVVRLNTNYDASSLKANVTIKYYKLND